MANLDRTMAQLTESVGRREATTIEQVKQAAEKHVATVELQWREKHEAYIEQSSGQISSLKQALQNAQDMHEHAVSSAKKELVSCIIASCLFVSKPCVELVRAVRGFCRRVSRHCKRQNTKRSWSVFRASYIRS